ncbi:MAG TPA: ROK family protein [Haliangiales bacterium]|nr:ROK family protein [Haliangiales bacterium]
MKTTRKMKLKTRSPSPRPSPPGEGGAGAAYSLGIDLGGSSVKAVAVTPSGEVLSRHNIDFAPSRKMEWAETIRALVQRLRGEHGAPAASIGVSAPGLAAADGRSIACMPERLQGLEGLDWTACLAAAKTVPVLNDAHAALLGEVWVGAARGFENVIMLTLGTGVGGAAMVDGRLLRGHIGRAGHLGHSSLDPDGPPDCAGTPGSLEVAIGNCTIQARSGGRFQTTHDLIAAYLKGDGEATAIWLKSVKALAAAVCSFINILDPEAVIIGGGIARAGKALFEPLQQFLDPMEWRPVNQRARILPAQLGEFAGAFGAAANGMKAAGHSMA